MLHGAVVWSLAVKTNKHNIQVIQKKVLIVRMIVNALWYVKNSTIRRDLKNSYRQEKPNRVKQEDIILSPQVKHIANEKENV